MTEFPTISKVVLNILVLFYTEYLYGAVLAVIIIKQNIYQLKNVEEALCFTVKV